MVQRSQHGGGCCGARHIHGFGPRHGGNNRDTVELQRLLSATGNNKLVEVILSNMQANESPELIEKLRELGFVYTTAWTGNHGTPVHRFERTGQRIALSRNTFNWRGMVASEGLHGTMPAIPRLAAAHANNADHDLTFDGRVHLDRAGARIRRGDTVEILGQSQFTGRVRPIISFVQNRNVYGHLLGYKAVFRHPNRAGETFSIVTNNLRRVRVGENIPAPRAIEGQIHQGAEQAEPTTVIFSTFHNNYRATGRGAGFDSYADAREAAPRCHRVDRRDIMSNGEIRWNDRVTE